MEDEMECRPRSSRIAGWLYDMLAMVLAMLLIILAGAFSLYREWVIWTK